MRHFDAQVMTGHFLNVSRPSVWVEKKLTQKVSKRAVFGNVNSEL